MSKRLSFNPATREIESIIGLALETTKGIFSDENKYLQEESDKLKTIMVQTKELLEMLNINVEKSPRKVTTSFDNYGEEEAAIKRLASYFNETVLKRLEDK